MRGFGRLTLACCCPLSALAPEAQAQEVLYTDTAEVLDPFSEQCAEGDAGELGVCNNGKGPNGEDICVLGEIEAGGCTYRIIKICWGRGLAMLLEGADLLLAHLAPGWGACPPTPAAGPSTAPGERPAWIAEAQPDPRSTEQRRGHNATSRGVHVG